MKAISLILINVDTQTIPTTMDMMADTTVTGITKAGICHPEDATETTDGMTTTEITITTMVIGMVVGGPQVVA